MDTSPTAETNFAVHFQTPATEEASQPFVGRWNQLVSQTNWQKGQIIHQWRDALIATGAPQFEYSDETWSRLVGGVTGQHTGRLRRVYARFGQVWESYPSLYWSHFHAAIEWDDAEMWLEGAVQNGWSVSQLRAQRATTLGDLAAAEPLQTVTESDLDEDSTTAAPLVDSPAKQQPGQHDASSPSSRSIQAADSGPRHDGPDFGDDDSLDNSPLSHNAPVPSENFSSAPETLPRVRPFAQLPQLPDDLAAAFDAFKLAILVHKAEGWKRISQEDLLASLDALKLLAESPEA